VAKKTHIGKIKVWVDVGRYFYSLIAQTITTLTVLRLAGYKWYVIITVMLIAVPILLLGIRLYMKYIYPAEQEYLWRKNPVVGELLESGMQERRSMGRQSDIQKMAKDEEFHKKKPLSARERARLWSPE
jgi:hypothetical protein